MVPINENEPVVENQRPHWKRVQALMEHFPWMDYLMAESFIVLDDQGKLKPLFENYKPTIQEEKNDGGVVIQNGEGR